MAGFEDLKLRQISDSSLIKLCQKYPPDRAIWDEFWRRFYPVVRDSVCWSVRRWELYSAELRDLMDGAFVEVIKTLPKIDLSKIRNIQSYFSAIARHYASDYMEALYNRRTHEIAVGREALEATAKTPDKDIARTLDLQKAIDGLKEADRKLLKYYIQGFSHKEIAETMGLSENAVRVRFHRIKKKLLKSLRNST